MTGSLSRKVFLSLLAVASLAMLLVLVPLNWNIYSSHTQQLETAVQSQGRILADMSTATILFDQPQSAETILASLRESSDIVSATLFRLDSDTAELTVFASYGDGAQALPFTPDAQGKSLFTDNMLHIVSPVLIQQSPVGYLYMQVKLDRLQQQITRGLALAAFAFAVALLVTLWLAHRLSHRLLRPVHELIAVTSAVAQTKDYSRRVLQTFEAETGELVASFNAMLHVIENYDTERKEKEAQIEQLNRDLEQRVEQRTKQLSDSVQHLKDTQLKLVEQEKMASLGSLVAGVAHEINTPVGVAMTAVTHLNYLTEELKTAFAKGSLTKSAMERTLADLQETTIITLRNLERAAEQVRSFKMVAVDQSNEELRQFNLKEYIENVVISLRPQLKRTTHQVVVDVPEHLQLNSYPGVYSQIFTNLIMNSLIHGFANIDHGTITIQAMADEEHLQLNYYDNGRGIAAAVKGKIFEPFVTTNRQQGGSGLGTYILYNLVTQVLKGRIDLVDDVQQGVHFAILLPFAQVAVTSDSH